VPPFKIGYPCSKTYPVWSGFADDDRTSNAALSFSNLLCRARSSPQAQQTFSTPAHHGLSPSISKTPKPVTSARRSPDDADFVRIKMYLSHGFSANSRRSNTERRCGCRCRLRRLENNNDVK
jgi:hypothetical protein